MKQPQILLGPKLIGEYTQNIQFKRKFLRLWDTEEISVPGDREADGSGNVTVMRKQLKYFPESERETNKKLLKLLHTYEDTAGPMQGVQTAWLLLNQDLAEHDYTHEIVANTLNTIMDEDRELLLNITTSGVELEDSFFNVVELETPEELTARVGGYLVANYQVVKDSYIVQGSVDDDELEPFLKVLAEYVLYDSPNMSTAVLSVTRTTTAVPYTVQVTDGDGNVTSETTTKILPSISVRLSVISTGDFVAEDEIVQEIEDAINTTTANVVATGALMNTMTYWNPVQAYNNDGVWCQGQLRASAMSDKYDENGVYNTGWVKTADIVKTVQKCIDSDYQQVPQKKAKWYQKLIAIVVFIVVVYFTGGGAGGWAKIGLQGIAAALSYGVVAVSLLSAGMSAWGDEGGAGWAARFTQRISPIVAFIGIASTVSNAVSNLAAASAAEAGKAAGAEAAKKAAASGASKTAAAKVGASVAAQVASTTTGITMQGIVSYVKSAMSGFTYNITTTQALHGVIKVVERVEANRMEKLESRFESLKSKAQTLAEEAQLEEDMKNKDLAMLFAKSYTNQLVRLEPSYDYPYEKSYVNTHRRVLA